MNAKTAIQDMADYSQMWHEGASSRRKIGGNSKDLAAITTQLSILGREMKKLSEQVHYVRVSCELHNVSHLSKDCPNKELVKEAEEIYYGQFYQRPYPNGGRYRANTPGYYVKDEKKIGYQEKIKSHGLLEKGVSRTLPSSTETNPRDQVKAIATIEGIQTNPNITSSLCPHVSCLSVQAKQVSHNEELKKEAPNAKDVVASYRPPIPSVSRLVENKSVDQYADVLTSLKKLKVNIPHMEALIGMPNYSRHLEDLLKKKSRIGDEEKSKMDKWCSAWLENTCLQNKRTHGVLLYLS
ncbi:hypothetical protein Tco_0151398 [Tanacetum coccineum]